MARKTNTVLQMPGQEYATKITSILAKSGQTSQNYQAKPAMVGLAEAVGQTNSRTGNQAIHIFIYMEVVIIIYIKRKSVNRNHAAKRIAKL